MGPLVQFLVVLAIAFVGALSGWPATSAVLRASQRCVPRRSGRRPVSPQSPADPGSGTIRASAETGVEQRPPDAGLRGGLWIGLVERFSCALAILMGQPGLIAVVVAVKGLGRFKEITTPEASERFVLGTLVSVTWACTVAAAGLLILS